MPFKGREGLHGRCLSPARLLARGLLPGLGLPRRGRRRWLGPGARRQPDGLASPSVAPGAGPVRLQPPEPDTRRSHLRPHYRSIHSAIQPQPTTRVARHRASATGLVSSRQGMGASFAIRTFGPPFLKVFTQSSAVGAQATLFAAMQAEQGSRTGPNGSARPAARSVRPGDPAWRRTRSWRAALAGQRGLSGFRHTRS